MGQRQNELWLQADYLIFASYVLLQWQHCGVRAQLATDVTPGPCNPALLGYTFQSGLSHDSGVRGRGRCALVLRDTEKYPNRGKNIPQELNIIQTFHVLFKQNSTVAYTQTKPRKELTDIAQNFLLQECLRWVLSSLI